MTLLYALLAFVMLAAFEAAVAAVGLAIVDRNLSQSLAGVASRAPAVAAAARRDRSLADAAFTIIERLRTPEVDVTIVDTTARAGYHDQPPPAGDLGPDPGGRGGPNDLGGPGGPGPGGPGPGGPPPVPLARSRSASNTPANAFLSALFSVAPLRVEVSGGAIVLAPTQARLAGIASVFGAAMSLALLGALLAATLIGRFVSRQALQPLERVIGELHRFGSGDFRLREIDPAIAHEFVDLARAYNAAGMQVQRAFEERAKADRNMRQFVADAAHELRTPLTIVTGYVDMLRQGLEPAEAERACDAIRNESRRMRELIANLIVLARLDAPQEQALEPVELSRLVEEALDAASVLLADNVVNVDVRTGIEVLGDAGELRAAVHNLVANAAKYAPVATITIALHAAESEAVLVVADDGPGMTERERENAFARFFRGENRGETEGSGLGLPIVRGAVERAGGTVTLETAPAAGARFTITLPLHRRILPLAKPGDAHALSRF